MRRVEKEKRELADNNKDKRLRFHFIKSNSFRVVHADGAYGGITPHGYIHMALFNERIPIPQETEHIIGPDGTLGDEVEESRIARTGVIREVEVDVIMNLNTATALYDWLEKKISILKDAVNKQGNRKDK